MIVHEVTAAFGSCWFVLYVVPSPLALRQRRSLRSFWFGVSFVLLMDDDLKFEYQDEPYEFVPNVRVGIRRLLTVPAQPAAPRVQLHCGVQDSGGYPEFHPLHFWDDARSWLSCRSLELYPTARFGAWCTPLFAAASAALSLPFATCGESTVSKQFYTLVRVLYLKRFPSTNLYPSRGLLPLGMGCPETTC